MSDEKTYTVKTPNPHFTGIREGVQFAEGTGQATKEKAAKLVNIWGYKCEELSEQEVKSETADGEDEESREDLRPAKSANKPVLIDFMDDQGIDRDSDDTKDDLNEKIDAWVAAQADEENTSPEPPSKGEGKESGATDSPEANGK